MPAARRPMPIIDAVSAGRTRHAEAVKVTFDPAVVSLGQILQVFFSVAHNPTELNRQGPDSGPQYRSEIFAQDDAQRQFSKAYIAQLDGAKAFPRPIVTLVGAGRAELYRQRPIIRITRRSTRSTATSPSTTRRR